MLLIGFTQYRHAPSLPAIANNLDGLREFFTSADGWGLPAEHCQVIQDATTADDLIAPLNAAATAARDTLFVYYAGHGILDEDLEFSLSLPDSRLHEPWTGVSYHWFRRALARSRATRRVAILDSCFSGKVHAVMGTTSQAVAAQAAATGTVVLTSARDDRVALAPEGEPYTAFTGELLTVLRKGIDQGPRLITVDLVYEQIKAALAMKGRPRPDRTGSDNSGHAVIAVNPAYTPGSPTFKPQPTTVPVRERLRIFAERLNAVDAPTSSIDPPGPVVAETAVGRKTRQPWASVFSAPSKPPAPQRRLPVFTAGRYEFTAAVAAGGMGEIFLAQDTLLGREVIVKRLRENGPEKEHLRYEARAAAALNHPSIATVYDVVTDASGDFIVMENVRGWTLAELRLEKRPNIQEVVAMLLEVLDGLQHSHEAGIIHCDIKPSNLMLTNDGRVKILDFGISSLNESVHQSDYMVGTPMFMPPEAWSGHAPHVTRDIYSTGTVMYELITAHPAHKAQAFPPLNPSPVTRPRDLVPDLDAGLEAVLLKALAPKPGDRYVSATEMRSALHRFL
ncbi:caspase, EACC1-associated type [Streptomyces sp. NPDC055051]